MHGVERLRYLNMRFLWPFLPFPQRQLFHDIEFIPNFVSEQPSKHPVGGLETIGQGGRRFRTGTEN